MSAGHVSRVRVLYKYILKLHRGLPQELQALGDQYVRDEFKIHKNCDESFIPTFMNEWTKYALTLSKQVGKRTVNQTLGLNLSESQLEGFSEEQLEQLYELYQETQKPVDPSNPLGDNPNATQAPDK